MGSEMCIRDRERGVLEVPVAKVFPLAETVAAHRMVEEEARYGAVIVKTA